MHILKNAQVTYYLLPSGSFFRYLNLITKQINRCAKVSAIARENHQKLHREPIIIISCSPFRFQFIIIFFP